MPDSRLGGVFQCPYCGLKFKATEWRLADPERQTCQNGHKKVKMVFYKNMTNLLASHHPTKEDYSVVSSIKK